MGNCCKNSKSYKNETGSSLLEKLILELPKESKVLIVKVVGANNLPTANLFNSADPFVQLSLSPAHEIAGPQKQNTSGKSGTLFPRWEPAERFQFILGDMSSSRLIISVYSGEVALGDAVLLLRDASNEQTSRKLKLVNPENGNFQGEIEFETCIMDAVRANSIQEHIVYEYQRYQPIVLWGNDYPGHLLPTDPGKYSSADGKKFDQQFDGVAPLMPEGWDVLSPWSTTLSTGDSGGWQYAVDFTSPVWHESQGFGMYVRRRLWSREVAAKAS